MKRIQLLLISLSCLACGPQTKVAVQASPPEAPIAACLERVETCLERYEVEALKGNRADAGQALLLHVLSTRGEEWLESAEMDLALALNPTPYLPTSLKDYRPALDGRNAPTTEQESFRALGFALSRPHELPEGVSYDSLRVKNVSNPNALFPFAASAMKAQLALWRSGDTVLAHPVAPHITLMNQGPLPAAPGAAWALAVLDAEKHLDGETPWLALEGLTAAYAALTGQDEATQTTRQALAKVARTFAFLSLSPAPEWAASENPLEAQEKRPATAPPSWKRPDLVWKAAEESNTLRSELFTPHAPLSSPIHGWLHSRLLSQMVSNPVEGLDLQALCHATLTGWERRNTTQHSFSPEAFGPLALQAAFYCNEGPRVGRIVGEWLSTLAHTDRSGEASWKAFLGFWTHGIGAAKGREALPFLVDNGFFSHLREQAEKALPKTRAKRVWLPLFDGVEALAASVTKRPVPSRFSQSVKDLRELALDRIPEDADRLWAEAPLVYGTLSVMELLISPLQGPEWTARESEVRSDLPHWTEAARGPLPQQSLKDLATLGLETARSHHLPQRSASARLDLWATAEQFSSRKPAEDPSGRVALLQVLAWDLVAAVFHSAGEKESAQAALASASNRIQSWDNPASPELALVHHILMGHITTDTSIPNGYKTGLYLAPQKPGESSNIFGTLFSTGEDNHLLPVDGSGTTPLSAHVLQMKASPEENVVRSVLLQAFGSGVLPDGPKSEDFLTRLGNYLLSAPSERGVLAASLANAQGEGPKPIGPAQAQAEAFASKEDYGQALRLLEQVRPPISARAKPVRVRCTAPLPAPLNGFRLEFDDTVRNLSTASPHTLFRISYGAPGEKVSCQVDGKGGLRPAQAVSLLSQKALYSLLGQTDSDPKALLDLALLLRKSIYSPGARSNLGLAGDPALLAWTATLARLRGHLLVGQELDSAAASMALFSNRPLGAFLEGWDKAPKGVPNTPATRRLHGLISAWVDVTVPQEIGTLRAASAALAFRTELIPLWTPPLAAEVLRAALGDVKTATINTRRLPRPKASVGFHSQQLWASLLGKDDDLEASVARHMPPVAKRYPAEATLYGIRLAARASQLGTGEAAMRILESVADSARQHPLLERDWELAKARILLATGKAPEALELLRSLASTRRLSGLTYADAVDVLVTLLGLELAARNTAGWAPHLPTLIRMAKESRGEGDLFTLRLQVLQSIAAPNNASRKALERTFSQQGAPPPPETALFEQKWSKSAVAAYLDVLYPAASP